MEAREMKGVSGKNLIPLRVTERIGGRRQERYTEEGNVSDMQRTSVSPAGGCNAPHSSKRRSQEFGGSGFGWWR